MVQGNKCPIVNPVAVLREELDDWAVLFNPDTGDVVGVNPVGVAVWKMMDGKNTVEEIVTILKARYTDVPESAVQEVTIFVDDLAEKGFVGYEVPC